MPKHITTLSIFLASPSDVAHERKIVDKVVTELNTTSLKAMGIQLDLINWEKSTYPSFGMYAQSVINHQIGDDYDIFLGIIWTRLGTPTPQSKSGTVEEFERAYSRINGSEKIEICFYFKTDPINPYSLDITQLQSVRNFKEKLNTLGGYHWDFTSNNFEETLRNHLFKIAQNWNKSLPNIVKDIDVPVCKIDEDEAGIYDLFEEIMELVKSITSDLNTFNDLTNNHNLKINQYTEQLDQYPDDFKKRKTIINQSSDHMIDYSQKTQEKFDTIRINFEKVIDRFMKFFNIYPDIHNTTNSKELYQILKSLDQTILAIPVMTQGNKKFLEAIKLLPRMTTSLNRSKKLMINTLEPFIEYLENLEIKLIKLQSDGFTLLASLPKVG